MASITSTVSWDLRLALWLSRIGLGYGLALDYLAQVLDAEGDVASRVAAEFSTFSDCVRPTGEGE